MLHTSYKIYMYSVFLECFSLLCYCIFYGEYARNGVSWPKLKEFGEKLKKCDDFIEITHFSANIFEIGSLLMFQFMLILIAKGFSVTRGKLPRRTLCRLTMFMFLYVLCYMAVYIVQSRVSKIKTSKLSPLMQKCKLLYTVFRSRSGNLLVRKHSRSRDHGCAHFGLGVVLLCHLLHFETLPGKTGLLQSTLYFLHFMV